MPLKLSASTAGLFAAILGVVSYLDATFGVALLALLGVVAFRYLYDWLNGGNGSHIFQSLGNYAIVVAGSSYVNTIGGTAFAGIPFAHLVVSALLLHELRLAIPQLTSLLRGAGMGAVTAAKDANAIAKQVEIAVHDVTATGSTAPPES